MDDKEKLRVLLLHWIEHNDEHKDEFEQWAEKAKGFGAASIHDDIMEAVKHLGEASSHLSKASKTLEA